MKSSRGSCNDVLRKTKEDEINLDLRTENSHPSLSQPRTADLEVTGDPAGPGP